MRKQVEKLILKDCNKFLKKLKVAQAAQPYEEIIDIKMYYIQSCSQASVDYAYASACSL